MPNTQFWDWIRLSEDGGAGGDAFFRSLRASGNLTDADILAREVIQNSWDAALKLRENVKDDGLEFRMNFEYRSLKGDAKKKFIKNAGLLDFERPLKELPKSSHSKDRFEKELKHLKSDEPLNILYCSDFGGHGLYGHPKLKNRSIMYRALYYLGGAVKEQGIAGGNFGFGKGAFVKGSKLHIVFAYSTFAKFESDKVQRRLIGCSFWDQFGEDFDGRGRFGVRAQSGPGADQRIVPYEESEAEKIADLLGFPRRKAHGPEDYGASFLLVSPSVEPDKLKDAVERSWWPALVSPDLRFNVTIKDFDGTKINIRPRENPVARHFIGPFVSAQDLDGNKMDQSELRVQLQNQQRDKLGVLLAQLVEDKVEDLEDTKGKHLILGRIALIRRPRMVVGYESYDMRRTPICGVFIADDSIDKGLQATEPSLHYQWATEPSEDIKPENTTLARSVMRGIKSNLFKWYEHLAPPPPTEDTYIRKFADMLSQFMKGNNPAPVRPPVAKSEPIKWRFISGPEPVSAKSGQVLTQATFGVRLGEDSILDSVDARIGVEFQITEDDRESGDSWEYELAIMSKSGNFIREGDFWIVTLTKSEELKFTFKSSPYDGNYTGRLKKFAEIENSIRG